MISVSTKHDGSLGLTRQFRYLGMLVLKCTADPGTELSYCSHVSRQAIHFIFHLLEVVLHLSYGVWEKEGWEDISAIWVCTL